MSTTPGKRLRLQLQRLRQVIVCVAVLTLIGCEGPTLTPIPVLPTATPPAPTPTLTPTPNAEPPPMIVTLELWLPEELDPYGEGGGSRILAQQLSEFSDAYPNLQVDVVVKKAHGRGGLIDFMRTARDAVPAVLPDLVVLDGSDLKTVAGSELVQSLDCSRPI